MKEEDVAMLPNRIRELRKARNWTLEQLGEKVGTSYANVSDIELGKVSLRPHWMIRFAAALGVQPADLLLPEHNADSLNYEERELVEHYRNSGAVQRRQMLGVARALATPS